MAVERLHPVPQHQPYTGLVDALRAHAKVLRVQADGIDAIADALESDRLVERFVNPDQRQGARGALSADAAAGYCTVGATTLREYGPPPRYVGGRAVWLREDLDEWLRLLSTEASHRRGRRKAPPREGGEAIL